MGRPYPGGAALDRAAQQGDTSKYSFPLSQVADAALDVSFSGLKTAAINLIHNAEQKGEELDVPSLSASFAETVRDMLVPRVMKALDLTGYKTLAIAGGVAANSLIRASFEEETAKRGVRLCMPPLSLCGDNGAMIGAQAYYEYLAGKTADQSLNAFATMPVDQ